MKFTALYIFTLLAMVIAKPAADVRSPLDFEMENINGEKVALESYKGKVVMIVNTASKCGLTPQYEGLQNLYETYKDKGFVVLGFPANNFMNQEPGTDEEIKEFCTVNYNVTFPMFSKISVKGKDKHPLYQYLTDKEQHEFGGEIEWNFAKFIVGSDGQLVARFKPKTKPRNEQVIETIETALEKR